ncbi:conserved phage C-terminal domain-containing protein [Clostridium sp.]|uniref:conserved phage C-terminal domain-containing protein n=1 Tax=Clostridium sp. TaxID=1506 RepID=UPI00290AA782|nr:conserved phage C-terminal domain-containing protein [Clostridium sp.]MDU5107278.1 conserved phage C-terminal domain-containing protein [Clostridium sp.]
MKYSFLGYNVKKIMEFNLDVKDLAILRYFDDFMESGKMNYEVIEGVKYYWISYKNIEDELPFLCLGKRSIMMRMLKLRDLGILAHYTKKEGGTFSYYSLGEKYKELLYINDNNDKDTHTNSNNNKENNIDIVKDSSATNDTIINDVFNKGITINEDTIQNNEEDYDNFSDLEHLEHKNEEPLYVNMNRGCAEKCSTNNHLLNNSSTKLNNLYNNIKEKVNSIINYLNLKAGAMYKATNSKTINLVKSKLKDGFTVDDFKTVIDKKVKAWKGTLFEQYLTPFTLFGDKFEIYLNQNVPTTSSTNVNNSYEPKNNYKSNKSLRFHNFKGRDYDYDALEKKLLGWD